jgi:hypothetical protein
VNTDSEKPGSGTAGNSARRRAEENSKNLDNGKSHNLHLYIVCDITF